MKLESKVEKEMEIARWENEGGSCRGCIPSTEASVKRTQSTQQKSKPMKKMKLMTRIVQAASHLPKPLHLQNSKLAYELHHGR